MVWHRVRWELLHLLVRRAGNSVALFKDMTKFRASFAVLSLASFVVACSTAKDDSASGIDSLLARDLTLAPSTSGPEVPVALGDTAVNSSVAPEKPAVAAQCRLTGLLLALYWPEISKEICTSPR